MHIDPESIDLEQLPESLRALVELIGFRDTLRLVRQRGGVFVYIPLRTRNAGVLRTLVSKDSVARLVDAFPGENLLIPKLDAIARQIRDGSIIKERRNGASYTELASRYQLTARQIITICNRDPEPESPQLDLFQ